MSQAAGWYRDPFHRDQERYFDGRVWTQGVRTARAEDPVVTSAEQAEPAEPVGPTAPIAAAPTAPPSPVPAWTPPQPDPLAAPLGGPLTWAPPPGVAPPLAPVGPRKRRRTGVVIGSVAAGVLVLGALGAGAAFVVGGHHDAAATEAITTAASKTLAAQSADMSMSMNISVLGHSVKMTGSGSFDFANQQGTFTVNMPAGTAGQPLTEQVLYDGQTVYVNVGSLVDSLGGAASVLGGKQWVSVDTSQFGSGSASALGGGLDTFGNPAAMLQQLQSQGGTVTSVGPTTYDGTAVTEYSVALPPSDIEKGMGQLPSSVQHALSGMTPPTIDAKVYVASGNMLKAIDLPISFSFARQTLSEDMTMVFSNFGTPVSVTPPPASEVIPFSQFAGGVLGGSGLGSLGNSGNTGNSGGLGNSGNSGNTGLLPQTGNSGNTGNTGGGGSSI